jgi:tyrosyl-tRNA synthetase
MPVKVLPAGEHKPHELLVAVGEASSKSEAARLVRQRAVKVDGRVIEPGELVALAPGAPRVLAIGPRRFVRLTARVAE